MANVVLQFAFLLFFCAFHSVNSCDSSTSLTFIGEKYQKDGIMEKIQPLSVSDCVRRCEERPSCHSVNYNRINLTCQLTNMTVPKSKLSWSHGSLYKQVRQPSQPPVTTDPCDQMSCEWNQVCVVNVSLNTAAAYCIIEYPRTCKDVQLNGETKSGIYTIYPITETRSIQVYCDMDTDGGGWTVFQRREDGTVDFFRGWTDYKVGFGDLNGEHWLGLDNIHDLTSKRNMQLRVDLVMPPNFPKYAKYRVFRVGDESMQYMLTVLEYFSGDAGDSFGGHNGMLFYTKDKDTFLLFCANNLHGSWWYGFIICTTSHLNGLYGSTLFGVGLNWITLTWYMSSVTFSEMKIRESP